MYKILSTCLWVLVNSLFMEAEREMLTYRQTRRMKNEWRIKKQTKKIDRQGETFRGHLHKTISKRHQFENIVLWILKANTIKPLSHLVNNKVLLQG